MAENLNRHNDGRALAASARAANDGRPFLGGPQDVERIVRQFAVCLLERYDEVGHGVLTPSDAAKADRDACMKMGVIFTGGDSAYAPSDGWTGAQLAEYLRNHMARDIVPEADDANTVAQAFAVLAHTLYDILRKLPDSPHQEVMRTVEKHVQALSWSLVGVQANG